MRAYRSVSALAAAGLALLAQPARARVIAGNRVFPVTLTSVDHSSVLYLMGPDGRFVAPIRADASAADIASLLERYVS